MSPSSSIQRAVQQPGSPSLESQSSRREWLSQVALGSAVIAGGLALPGCDPKPVADVPANAPAATVNAKPLRLLVIDDARLGKAIAANWKSKTEKDLTVNNLTSAELGKTYRLPADVVVFPTGALGTLAERDLIAPLSVDFLEQQELEYRDFFPHTRLIETTWASKVYAISLGSPQWMLVYRQDLLDRLGLAIPKTWAEYQAVAEKLATREALGDLAPPADQPWQASCETLAPGWAGQWLLARAASYAADPELVSSLFSLNDVQPLIASPPYARALQELVAAAKVSGTSAEAKSPAEAFADISSGHCGMALTWPTSAQADGSPATAPAAGLGKLGYALLPMGESTYRFEKKEWQTSAADSREPVPLVAATGRLAAISSTANQPQNAQELLGWLSQGETAARLVAASPSISPVRQSEAPTVSRWLPKGTSRTGASQFFTVLATSQTSNLSQVTVRLPGYLDYLASLDQAVAEAIAGKPPEEALESAAKRWNEISAAKGIPAQKLALLHSVGITATGRK